MEKTPQYYIVEAAALPEIFRKVAEAKRMLETGETDKVNEAAKAVGISRSAFYKYRDTIAPFQNMMAGRIITFQLMLKHKAGILSEILSIFANCGANILTRPFRPADGQWLRSRQRPAIWAVRWRSSRGGSARAPAW